MMQNRSLEEIKRNIRIEDIGDLGMYLNGSALLQTAIEQALCPEKEGKQ